MQPIASKDIVDTAVGAGKFTTLVAAVKAAGLVDTLKGKGPFTVFAPTDDAFAKLPKGTVENLLKPENKEKLVAILTYHVVPGKIMSKDIAGKKTEVKTVQGQQAFRRRDIGRQDRQCQGHRGRCRDVQWRHSHHRYGRDAEVTLERHHAADLVRRMVFFAHNQQHASPPARLTGLCDRIWAPLPVSQGFSDHRPGLPPG